VSLQQVEAKSKPGEIIPDPHWDRPDRPAAPARAKRIERLRHRRRV